MTASATLPSNRQGARDAITLSTMSLGTAAGVAGGVVIGVLVGASAGAIAGPIGALVGAVVGLVIGVVIHRRQPARVAVGNLVWIDDGAGGVIENNGIIDGTEAGVDGVTVELYAGTAATGTPLATTVTSGGGFYLFDQLDAGNYVVHIPASQFAANAPLENYVSSTGVGGDDTNDDNVDENGLDTLDNGGVSSAVVNLLFNVEPTGEAGQGTYTGSLDDDNVNMTVDFGFYEPTVIEKVAIGNLVWEDTNDNGQFDGSDSGIDNVVVELYSGATVSGLPMSTTTTSGGGFYLFDQLDEGT
ncbi:MAG: SdrD B-like domain-containing protein, partial [Pseudomonadota bacterium]